MSCPAKQIRNQSRSTSAICRTRPCKVSVEGAALRLSRLWQRQGKGAEAYQLLAEVYGWFPEGFNTATLQEARALLEELSR